MFLYLKANFIHFEISPALPFNNFLKKYIIMVKFKLLYLKNLFMSCHYYHNSLGVKNVKFKKNIALFSYGTF